MSPENQQTVYTMLDVLALLLPVWLTCFAFAGLMEGSARIVASRPWLLLWVISAVWLVLRAFGVIA